MSIPPLSWSQVTIQLCALCGRKDAAGLSAQLGSCQCLELLLRRETCVRFME